MKKHQIKAGWHPAIRLSKACHIDLSSADQHRPACWMPQAGLQCVAFAHLSQLSHQMPGRCVADVQGQAVGHRQSQTRALQDRTQIPNFAHRGHTRRQPARYLDLCLAQGRAQLVQRLAPETDPKKRTIRAQGPRALYDLAHRIIGPVQRQRMDHQIIGALRQVQNLMIGDNMGIGPGGAPNLGKGRDNRHVRKLSVNHCQPILQLIPGGFVEKQRILPDTQSIASQGIRIGQAWRCGHDGGHSVAKSWMQTALHALYPPQCLACKDRVESDYALCGACRGSTVFIHGMICDRCGLPLPGEPTGQAAEDTAQCDDCLRIARPWSQGRAALMYSGIGRSIVLALKHGDRQDIAGPAAHWMAQSCKDVLAQDPVIVPVPLHLTRLIRRRYNQSALLASALARLTTQDSCLAALARTRRTPSLEGKTRDARFAALAQAIRPHPRHAQRLAGRNVLLVDDVMTSGATLAACTEAAFAAGAKDVNVTVLARVGKDG